MEKINSLPELQQLKTHFSFSHEEDSVDYYWCRCGHHYKTKLEGSSELVLSNEEMEYLGEFKSIINDAKMLSDSDASVCPSCKTNYIHPSYKRLLIRSEEVFTNGFHVESNDEHLIIHHYHCFFLPLEKKFNINTEVKSLFFSKKDESVLYQGLKGDKFEVDLNNAVSVVKDFFETETNRIMGLHHLHHFINSLASYVPDSDSINLMKEIISKMSGNSSSLYSEAIKIFSIFISIRLYSNLSTLAITKGPLFFYDVINKCHLPSAEEMKKNKVTAPLPIFNFLIKNYIDLVNDEISGEDRESRNFIYKSDVEIIGLDEENKEDEAPKIQIKKGDEKQMTIKVRSQKSYEKALQLSRAQRGQKKGSLNVKEKIEDGAITKFIFKRIETFKEYEKLIRFFKFLDTNQLISLMQKWPKEFLVAVIDKIYHRRECEPKEMEQIFKIMHSFVEQESKKKAIVDEEGRIHVKMNYDLVEDFDFAYYDDAIMAIEYLYRIVPEEQKSKFVRKHYFNKIKTYDALVKFHDGIITQQNYFSKTEEGSSDALKKVVDKYRWIEKEDEDYKGLVKVQTLDSFEKFILEGQEMNHSAGRYAHKTLDEEMLVCKLLIKGQPVNKDENLRFTLGLVIDYYDGIVFDALKGPGNTHASDRVIKEVRDWLEFKKISIRNITDIKYRGDNTLNLENS